MDRREMLGVLGAAAIAAGAGREARADGADECCKLDQTHEECLRACGDCAKACDMAFHHCLTMLSEGKKEHAKSAQLASDCAGFCSLSACMIAKHSPLMVISCHACAEACRETAAEVGKHDDEMMKKTAKALMECERSCTAMVKAMGGHHHHDANAKAARTS